MVKDEEFLARRHSFYKAFFHWLDTQGACNRTKQTTEAAAMFLGHDAYYGEIV